MEVGSGEWEMESGGWEEVDWRTGELWGRVDCMLRMRSAMAIFAAIPQRAFGLLR
jgi:hypothetical protein